MLSVIEIAKVIAEIGFIPGGQERADQDQVGDLGAKRADRRVLAVCQEAVGADTLAQHTFHHASLDGVRLDDDNECQVRSLA
jgi:hypothetical protein